MVAMLINVYEWNSIYYATFIDTKGKFLADGAKVQFSINGIIYTYEIRGNKDQAGL